MFFFIMTHKIMHERHFSIRIDKVIRRSGIKCCLSEWRRRIKRQSQTTIILLADTIVAIIHLLKYNKYPISIFLLEPLAKKGCSVSFVSQYITRHKRKATKTTLSHVSMHTRSSHDCVYSKSNPHRCAWGKSVAIYGTGYTQRSTSLTSKLLDDFCALRLLSVTLLLLLFVWV